MSEIDQFIIFCVENYKFAMNLSGEQALKDFEDYDVFSYLANGFDVLHTQGKEYLVADIKDYLALRK
jgi:hypothetical protein